MTWREIFERESKKQYWTDLQRTLNLERQQYTIYPPASDTLKVFSKLSFDNVKVVMLGQNPYHGPGQAHGLAFSVQKGVRTPPSLQNIYKELKSDVGITIPTHGNLDQWVDQGVLLLNSSLTVRAGVATSHMNIGWESFTDTIIRELSSHREGVIFVLWGQFASTKQRLIDKDKHYILSCAHPSPYSADRGFFGCKHFSKINDILLTDNKTPIDWQIT